MFEELNSRLEELHNLVEVYQDLSHYYKLTSFHDNEHEDDEDNSVVLVISVERHDGHDEIYAVRHEASA